MPDGTRLIMFSDKEYQNACYAPTLEELMEACGDGFSELRRNYPDVPMGAPGKWLACHTTPDKGETDDCWVGDSATETVAKLWLDLNKKGRD